MTITIEKLINEPIGKSDRLVCCGSSPFVCNELGAVGRVARFQLWRDGEDYPIEYEITGCNYLGVMGEGCNKRGLCIKNGILSDCDYLKMVGVLRSKEE